ncbi:MAG: Xaa-Pro peptidase family protein [Clostridiales Family XIII bacterium]|jgi:Xaa-Pro aminopeptidase|nr:Xaa-Pro peptidase family protein [Clostridiales Family XIII bacterium]
MKLMPFMIKDEVSRMGFPLKEAENRTEIIRSHMAAEGIGVLVAYSMQWKSEIVHYLSNYRMLGLSACVVLPLSSDPVLFISEEGDMERAASTGWIRDVRLFDGYDLTEVIALARMHGNVCAVAGLEILTAKQYAAFDIAFCDHLRNGLHIIDEAAKIKSPWEIKLLEDGGQLADIGFLAEISAIHCGLKEYELAADMNFAMCAAGADDNFQMLAAGKDLSCMHVPREKKIESGDLILSEITPMKCSITYAVQLCRTAKLGKATSIEYDKYMLLVEALEKSLSAIKPGVRAGEIAKIQNQIIGAEGYEKYCKPPYMRSRGHNFGLGQFELTEDNEEELREGMAMVVHPNQYLPETGYLACGETIIVTATGIRRLSKLPVHLYEIEEVTQ